MLPLPRHCLCMLSQLVVGVLCAGAEGFFSMRTLQE